MPAPIIIKINLRKINQAWCFKNDNGSFPDLVLYENDREDAYGNSHVLKQSPPREERGQTKPIIVGNGKWMPQRNSGFTKQTPEERQNLKDMEAKARADLDSGSSDDIPW